ncbi:hypothetical protein KAU11_12410 [Candidatus Babeliales bacterium]|nr:hypothetical protein [Candidatus Babeliales bacterium]
MAINAAHWTITRTTGAIRYIGPDHDVGGETYATVIEFHRWLQDLADDPTSTGDDELDITELTPSARSTDNIITLKGIYNIDATAAEHLYDGSIIQGTVGVDQIIYDGIVNFGNQGIVIQVIQDGAVLADDWWNKTGAGINEDTAQGISHRFMIKTHDFVGDGGDVDGRRLIGTARTYGNTYSEFSINGTSRGNNVFALVDAADLNNATISGTVAGYTGISNTEGYRAIDISDDGIDEFYFSEFNTNQPTRSINDFYEKMKYDTRDGSAETLYGLSGELFRGVTHEVVVDTPTGTFSAVEALAWGTGATAGTGQMFAINSTTAGTKLWMQLLTGVVPTDGVVMTGGTSAATITMNVTITERTISKPFIGASTGSALIGAYGIGLEPSDTSATDTFFDLDNAQVTPPNNVTFTVSGLVSGDRVLVAPWDGVTNDSEGNPAIQKDQLGSNVAVDSATVTSLVMDSAIPTDTPSAGDIRVLVADGRYLEVPYSSYTGSTFTIPSFDFSTGSNTNIAINANIYISYLDIATASTSESFTGVYSADRDFVVIVRDGGASPIKQFISSGALTNTGGSITAIRTTDE